MLSAHAGRRARRTVVGARSEERVGVSALCAKGLEAAAGWRMPGKKPDQIARGFIGLVYLSVQMARKVCRVVFEPNGTQ